jgi:transcriptional regulator with PAS, ATPase and Fis domain
MEKRTLDLLKSYAWQGSIRELQNVIERSVIFFCEAAVFSVNPSWLSFESSPLARVAGQLGGSPRLTSGKL